MGGGGGGGRMGGGGGGRVTKGGRARVSFGPPLNIMKRRESDKEHYATLLSLNTDSVTLCA